MSTCTTHERIKRMYEHREADRVPVWELPWPSTVRRWRREGMPTDDYWEYFDIARIGSISVDNSPRYPVRTLEETDRFVTSTTPFGVTVKNWRHTEGVPEYLGYTIVDRVSWSEAKGRMRPSSDRIDWDYLRRNYAGWRREGAWIVGELWFGFDVTHARIVGTERVLLALCDDPEWIKDMIDTMLDLDLALLEMVWEAGYTFDELYWPDDLGYKHHQFISPQMYREIVKPAHRRAAEWAHAKGLKVRLHSCGCVSPFIPDFVELGVDMLNPLEVKAGIQPWLDEWNLIPGEPCQEAIEEALENCATCAVFIGPSGTGPWQNEQMRAAVQRRVDERHPGERPFRVIPVLLPAARRGEGSKLPTFLVATTWVEFRRSLDDEDAFHRLVSGIRA